MLVAGIDCGTQGTKIVVYDADEKIVVSRSQSPHDLIAREDGTREQEARWWIDALAECLSAIEPEVRKQIVALGVSGQQHGFVPLDEAGEVLGNVKLWNDTSTVAECDEIHERIGGAEAAVRLAGNPVLPGYTASKVVWLKNHHPQIYERLHTILLPHDYLNFVFTGNRTMEYGDASGTGFLDVRTRTWSMEVLAAMDSSRDLSEVLPPLIDSRSPSGVVSLQTAARFGLSPGVLVSSGGGDNMMGAIGTGAVRSGAITISLGTSGTLYVYSDTPVISEDAEFAAFCSSTGGWLPLLCTMNCTSATELVRSLLGLDLGSFEDALGATSPGAGGIVSLPFFDGERTPNLPHGKGVLAGMSATNLNPKNVLRAVVESTVFGLKGGLASLQTSGVHAEEIHVIGGGANSRHWRQIISDVFNVPVLTPTEPEAAALGAALQALWCYESRNGGMEGIEAIVREHVRLDSEQIATPIPGNVARYSVVFSDYRKALRAIGPLYR